MASPAISFDPAEQSVTISNPVPPGLLIGIGDLHGHYPALEALLDSLQRERRVFSDRNTLRLKEGMTFVFTGDYIDRGNQALKIIATLQQMAEQNPGQIHPIAGNHELMALADYDHAKNISQGLRNGMPAENAFADYISRGRFQGSCHGVNGGVDFLKEFGSTPQEAFEGYVGRMKRGGDIGNWMRELQPCFKAHFLGRKILFTHADMPEDIVSSSAIRHTARAYIRHVETTTERFGGSQKKYADESIRGSTIFWERRFYELDETEMQRLVEGLDAQFLVVGHSVHPRIHNYHGLAFDIDVGMTPRYGENEPAALVFAPDGIYGHYARKGEEKLVDY
ncbi:MAG: metallophosphoesterase [Nanoarchaeota archaeon]